MYWMVWNQFVSMSLGVGQHFANDKSATQIKIRIKNRQKHQSATLEWVAEIKDEEASDSTVKWIGPPRVKRMS